MDLPPGFQFEPTDEELIVHFLRRKAARLPCDPDIIPELNLYHFDPWELNGKALEANNQWYFFAPNAENRVSSNGYWKELCLDEPISSGSKTVGMKKSFIFYVGESPVGMKTNWAMHEYYLNECSSSAKSSKRRGQPKGSNDWVLCRVLEINCSSQTEYSDDGTELSCLDEVFLSLDDLDETNLPN